MNEFHVLTFLLMQVTLWKANALLQLYEFLYKNKGFVSPSFRDQYDVQLFSINFQVPKPPLKLYFLSDFKIILQSQKTNSSGFPNCINYPVSP